GRGPGALGAALVGPRQPPHPPRGRPRGGRAVTVREIDLTPRRLPGWLERFRTEHEAVWSLAGGALELAGAGGASARLRGWVPLAHDPPGAPHEPVVRPEIGRAHV